MAEKIKITNSYFKELYVSKTNDYGVETPVDLTKYDDCYVVFKKDRNVPDEEAYYIKKIEPDLKKKGTIPIYLSPEETTLLPLTGPDLPYIYMFVHLGSTATGENIEIDFFKVKTEYAGLRYYTKVDTSLNDLGHIKGYVGFVFDCGELCEPPVYVIDVAGGAPIVFDCGKAPSMEYEIIDLGSITSPVIDIYDLYEFKGYCYG
jgi:hypothetical protein